MLSRIRLVPLPSLSCISGLSLRQLRAQTDFPVITLRAALWAQAGGIEIIGQSSHCPLTIVSFSIVRFFHSNIRIGSKRGLFTSIDDENDETNLHVKESQNHHLISSALLFLCNARSIGVL